MKKLIIYTHFKNTEFEKINFDHLKKLNPNWDIVPVGFNNQDLIENSLSVNPETYPCNKKLSLECKCNENWLSCDILIAETFFNYPNYDGYFLYEFDTICNVPIENFFEINGDFLGNNCEENIQSKPWEWINYYKQLTLNTSSKLGTSGQNTCMYFSKNAISHFYNEMKLNKNNIYDNMLSELRIGTIVQQKFKIKRIKETISKYVSCDPNDKNLIDINLNEALFYHPVKSINVLKECIEKTKYY